MIDYLQRIANHQWCSLSNVKDDTMTKTKTKQDFFLDLLSSHAYVLHPFPPLPNQPSQYKPFHIIMALSLWVEVDMEEEDVAISNLRIDTEIRENWRMDDELNLEEDYKEVLIYL